eukprot:scaffold846_cov252-Pinguiococcus_pyrenoidosus.AAC.33
MPPPGFLVVRHKSHSAAAQNGPKYRDVLTASGDAVFGRFGAQVRGHGADVSHGGAVSLSRLVPLVQQELRECRRGEQSVLGLHGELGLGREAELQGAEDVDSRSEPLLGYDLARLSQLSRSGSHGGAKLQRHE